MKQYEAQFGQTLDRTKPYMIRLDGHKFSSFTRPFKHPFDVRIHNAMTKTMMDLIDYFHCPTGFTCSDEISLVFPLSVSEENPNELIQKNFDFNGKVSKITSLSSAYASVRFYKYLIAEKYDLPQEQKLLDFIEQHPPHFDSRVFELPSNAEIVNNLVWRARIDFRRNSISTLAHAHFTPRQLHGINTKQMIAMLVEKSDRWEDQPLWYRFGVFAKKEKFIKQVQVKNETVTATRTRTVARNIELSKEYTKTQEEWMLSKFWPAEAMSYPTDVVHPALEVVEHIIESESSSSSAQTSSPTL
jgi:tRNA(His) guanylyltransferase